MTTNIYSTEIENRRAALRDAEENVRIAEAEVTKAEDITLERARLLITDRDGAAAANLETAKLGLDAAKAARDAAKASVEEMEASLVLAVQIADQRAQQNREAEAKAQRDAAQQRLDYLVKQLHLDEFPEVMRVRAEAVVAELVSMCQACYTHARERSEWASEARDLGDDLGVKVQAAGDNDREYMIRVQRMIASTLESPAHADYKWRKVVAGWLPAYDLRWLIGQWI